MAIRRKHIRQVVNQLLEDHGVEQAPVLVEEMAARMGANINRMEVEDNLSGFLFRQGAAGTIIGVNQRHHHNRQRFTIAHELGHMVLHTGDPVHWDYRLRFRRESSDPDEQPDGDEVEANYFAAELLMPVHFLMRDLQQYDFEDFMDDEFEERVLLPLANQYQVSKQAMAIRLQTLGYITL